MSALKSEPTLRVGSAPAPSTICRSPSGQIRAESPFCSNVRGVTAGFSADRHRGVLHRIDSQMVFHSNCDLQDMDLVRCPSCRMQSQLMCPVCVASLVRVNRLRDAYRSWFLKKAEICAKLDKELQPRMNLELDLHSKEQAVKELRKKIAGVRDNISRIQRRVSVLTHRGAKCAKNIQTLEMKKTAHAQRIRYQAEENEKLKKFVEGRKADIFKYVRFYVSLYAHYFPIERYIKPEKAKPELDSSVSDMMRAHSPSPPQWPPLKKYYFTLNGCAIDDNSAYDRLLCDLLDGSSSLFLSRHSKHAYAALSQTLNLVNGLSVFVDLPLPYQFTLKDFVKAVHWTQDLFHTDIHRLNVNVIAICAAFGIKSDQLKVTQPYQNLFNLVAALKNNKVNTMSGIIDEHIKHQIIEAFYKFSWEERQDRFELENLEEGWVNVGLLN